MRRLVLCAWVGIGLAGGAACAQVCDIPQLGMAPADGFFEGASRSGGVLCAAVGSGGMLVYDVSDPANPVLLSSLFSPFHATDVVMDGTLAYLSEVGVSEGLRVVDVSDPSNPVVLDRTGLSTGSLDLANSGSVVCVAVVSGMSVLDVTDPTAVAVVGDLPVKGDVLDLACEGSLAYVTTSEGELLVVDVSDPAEPTVVGMTGTMAGYVDVSGSVVVTRGQGVLQVFDVQDPWNPTMLGSVAFEGFGIGVSISGPLACVPSLGAGIRAFDVSNPATPVEVGASTAFDGSLDVLADGTVAYVMSGGLRTLDLSTQLACARAEFAEPVGDLDFSDVLGFVTAFAVQDKEADLAEPEGEFDLADVMAYLEAFGECTNCSPYRTVPHAGRYLYRPEGVEELAPVSGVVVAAIAPFFRSARRRSRV